MTELLLWLVLLGVAGSPTARRVVARRIARWRHQRAADRRATCIGAYAFAVARRLHAGETLLGALSVGTSIDELVEPVERMLVEHDQGVTLGRAAQRWALRDQTAAVKLFATAVDLAARQVGTQPAIFERVAASARAGEALVADARASAAGATASVWVVAVLPWVVGAGLIAEGGAAADVLIRSTLGWSCIGAAAALEALGIAWMRGLIRWTKP